VPRLRLLEHPAVRSAVARELGREIEYHVSIDSTQTRARELANDGSGPGIVVTDEQRAGQGTHGRAWHAAAGTSLLASWILRPAPAAPGLFAALSGVAIARAFDALGTTAAHLKWPNDVELAGKKVAGALAYGSSDGGGGLLVIGIGVNLHQRTEDFPAELRETATSLAIAGRPADRLALLARITAELDRLEDEGERARAMDEWRERCSVIGKLVEVRITGREPFTGIATAIDDDGALLIRTTAGVERVIAGDVRPA
jgi:BirA family transcriptional regulator, biotin operon repressor / biotin---[acetyl-CoA-carboxylase] ligase